MRLYLIRHAESYGNIKGKIISTTDFELTEKGIAQSRRIGQETLEITESDSLKEMNLGLLEGMTWEERRQKYPEIDLDEKLSLLQAPYGESYQDVKKRCQTFIERYLEKRDNDRNIIIVSHGITLRILTNLLLNRPDDDINCLNWMENTALTELVWEKESHTYQIIRLNDYSHLGELKTIGYENWGLFAKHDYLAK